MGTCEISPGSGEAGTLRTRSITRIDVTGCDCFGSERKAISCRWGQQTQSAQSGAHLPSASSSGHPCEQAARSEVWASTVARATVQDNPRARAMRTISTTVIVRLRPSVNITPTRSDRLRARERREARDRPAARLERIGAEVAPPPLRCGKLHLRTGFGLRMNVAPQMLHSGA